MPDLEGLDSPPRVIAVYIAGAWSADDFSQLLRNLEDTYNLSAVLAAGLLGEGHVREQFFPLDRRKVRHLAGQRIEAPLAVIRLQYASPGSVDLVGLGTLAGHVKEFLLGLLDRYQNRRFRQLD